MLCGFGALRNVCSFSSCVLSSLLLTVASTEIQIRDTDSRL